MNSTIFSILLVVVGLFVGAIAVVIINKIKVSAAQKEADKLIQDAKREAEKAKRDGILELKEESYKLKSQTDAEIKEKKKELNELNQRIDNREKSLDRRDELLTEREKNLDKKDKDLLAKSKEIQEKDAKMESIIKEQIALLEKISGFSKEKARELVLKKVEEEMSNEIATYLRSVTKNVVELDADKADATIRSAFRSMNFGLTRFATFTIINNNVEDNRAAIIDNIKATVDSEYLGVYTELALYKDNNVKLCEYLNPLWKEDLSNIMIDVIFNHKLTKEQKIYNVHNRLGIDIANYSTIVHDKFIN